MRRADVRSIAVLMLAACASPLYAQDPPAEAQRACVRARRLWYEDFESGDYGRWTSRRYDTGWGPESRECRAHELIRAEAHAGSSAHRSRITCPSHTDVHRGYGGIQFAGESVLSEYTNAGRGLDAPHGVVATFWTRLEVPYAFGGGRWLSLFTVDTSCAWSEEVVTLGLDTPERRLTPAHVTHLRFAPNAPPFPLRAWVRVTVYVNAHRGELRVWQDGAAVAHARFSRPSRELCQWHWGLYASGDNDSVVLDEDDKSLWILDQDWSDSAIEPWLENARICQ